METERRLANMPASTDSATDNAMKRCRDDIARVEAMRTLNLPIGAFHTACGHILNGMCVPDDLPS